MMIEITYETTVTYGVEVEDSEYAALAKHLGISKKKLVQLAQDGELWEHEDGITKWLSKLPPERTSAIEESAMDNIEYTYS